MNLGIVIVELVLLGGMAFLSWLIPKGKPNRNVIALQCIALGVTGFVASGVFSLATINYRMSPGWIIALAACVLVIGALAFMIVSKVGMKIAPIAGLILVFALSNSAFSLLAYSDAGANVLRDRYAARAIQIGDAAGMTVLVPAKLLLPVDQLPVNPLPSPDRGIAFVYPGFELQERRPTEPMNQASLMKVLSAGAKPMGDMIGAIPPGTRATTLTVAGTEAVAVQYVRPSQSAASPTQKFTMLAMYLGGVDVRMWSGGYELYINGKWQQHEAYTPSELGAIAATLQPIR